MDKEKYRRIEGMLYGHYKEDLKRITSIRNEIELTKKNIKKIDEKIKSCDVDIDYYQSGIEISERVQTSSTGTSYAEREIIKGIDNLEKEKAHNIKRLYKLEEKERNLVYKVEKLEKNINELNDISKEFIELKYNPSNKYKRILSVREIAEELHMGKDAAYKLKDSVIESISLFMFI